MSSKFTILIAPIAFVAGLLASSLSPRVVAQGVANEITARSFRLVDENNVERAALFPFGRGAESGTTFSLKDRRGNTRVLITVDEQGTPNLHLWDRGSDGTYTRTSFPSIMLWDSGQRRLRAQLPNVTAPTLGRGGVQRGGTQKNPDQADTGRSDFATTENVGLLRAQVDLMQKDLTTLRAQLEALRRR